VAEQPQSDAATPDQALNHNLEQWAELRRQHLSAAGNEPARRDKAMKRLNHSIIIAAFALLATASVASAVTLYVDQRYGPGGNGTANSPYNTIQTAIDDVRSDAIVVYPGTYRENLLIDKNVKIYGYDGPNTTKVDGSSNLSNRLDTITIKLRTDVTLEVWIEGLNISSGRYGIYQPTMGILHLKNCLVCGNTSDGVYVERTDTGTPPDVYIHNSILAYNAGSGLALLSLYANWVYYFPNVTVLNTILVGNGSYGIEANSASINYGAVTLDYNDVVGNTLAGYSGLFGPGKPVPTGAHSIAADPVFVGGTAAACSKDFRLVFTSPCKDTGHPGIGFLDPDGTLNDMGAYGGPGAQHFYTNPNDGPIIRSVTIDQGMVPKGSTFTIRADGAVR
jgi:hypothetical protein